MDAIFSSSDLQDDGCAHNLISTVKNDLSHSTLISLNFSFTNNLYLPITHYFVIISIVNQRVVGSAYEGCVLGIAIINESA